MKASFKSLAIVLVFFAFTLAVLAAVDYAVNADIAASDAGLRVTVCDLEGNPVHNAQVLVNSEVYYSDDKGLSPSIALTNLTNIYNAAETQWYTVNVIVKSDGYVPSVILNCVMYSGQTRHLTVKIYPCDSSELPYICYVESPPHEYLKQILDK